MAADLGFVTFDCYGTLIDWEEGIFVAFSEAVGARLEPIDRRRILQLYARIEPEVEAEEYRRYREVLDVTAARVAERLEVEIPASRSRFLSASLPEWPPFPDTVPALQTLSRAGYRLGILSNVDDDLLPATLRQLPVRFDLLVTAEQVGSYKPAGAHFLEARRRIGEAPWLHVAQSFFHDVQPAVAARVPVVWINRKRESALSAARPLAEFEDLSGFVAELLGGHGLGGGRPDATRHPL
jgi:2-haloacid dehalogenase/putative hydrolase of the HAD superfamily